MKAFPLFLVILLACLILASFQSPVNPGEIHSEHILLKPSWDHWLGTDSLGRDFFWRLILGLRTTVLVALGSTGVSFCLGVALGSLSALSRNLVGFTLNRLFDVIQGLPSFLFLAVIMQFFISTNAFFSILSLAFFCGLFHWPQMARLTRAQLFKTLKEPYVEAARSLGATQLHILWRHLWPSAYQLWIFWFCYHVPSEILFESTLSFLGLGLQPPQTSLGLLIQEGWKYLDDEPQFLFAPALLSFLLVLGLRRLLKSEPLGISDFR
jgi:oligopeptide transport system permease protein